MKCFLGFSLISLSLFATACVEDSEVRGACAHHGGVNAVSGNSNRQFVACKDGYFVTVR